jgi:death-on-curing protein
MIRYLTAEELLIIHSLIIEETGGSHGVRDIGLLESIVARPQIGFSGKDLHPNVFTKVAVFAEAITNYHAFIDGNKRAAFVAAARFLDINGYQVIATNREVEQAMLAVAEKRMNEIALAVWFKKHSKKDQK